MEATISIFYFILSLLILLIFLRLSKSHKNLPPSPPSLPILGHLYLHFLKPPLHRTLHGLSQSCGPIMSLRVGSHNVVVVSSSSGVEECFTKNEKCFSNRPMFLEGKLLESSYSSDWGALRRVLTVEVFSSQRLNMFLSIRKDEIKRLITKLHLSEGQDFKRVELRPMFEDLAYNVVLRMIAAKRYYGDNVKNKEEADEFKEILKKLVMCVELSSLGDFVPILKWIDFGRSEKKMNTFGEKIDRFLQRLINECREMKGDSNTMIDRLLTLQKSKPANCTDENIKGLMGDEEHALVLG